MRRMLLAARAIALALLLVVLPLPAPGAEPALAYASVVLNGVDSGQLLIAIADDDAFVQPEDLRKIGLPAGSAPVTIRGLRFVPLSSLQGLSWAFDTSAVKLTITAGAELLPHARIDLASNSTERPARMHDPGFVLDYNTYLSPGQHVATSLTQRLSLQTDRSIANTIGETLDGRFVRGLTQVIADDPMHLRSITFGDSVAGSGDLGGATTLAGITVARAFDLNPYSVYYPLPSIRTTVLAPSVADIYVNGALVRSVNLAPGTYDLQDLPVIAGYSRAQVKVRDILGAPQSAYQFNYYSVTTLLRRGLSDYSYSAGLARPNVLGPNDGYGRLAALGQYRIGLTDFATAGARYEAGNGASDGGLVMDASVGDGAVHGAYALSRSGPFSGSAALLGYSSTAGASAYALSLAHQTPYYATVSVGPGADRPISSLALSASRRLSRATSLSFTQSASWYRDAGMTRGLALSVLTSIRKITFSLGYNRTTAAASGSSTTAFFSLARPVGSDDRVTLTAEHDSTLANASTLGIQHLNPTPFGWYYDAALGLNPKLPFSGTATLGLPALQSSFRFDRVSQLQNGLLATTTTSSMTATGSLTLLGGRLVPSQPVGSAYALVETAGLANVPIYQNHHFVGRTDRTGHLLVPSLQANESNHLDLVPEDLPMDWKLDRNSADVTPTRNGGAIVRFAIEPLRAFVGRIRIEAGGASRIPSYAAMTVEHGSTKIETELDRDGRFYLDEIAPGSYTVTIASDAGTCTLDLKIPVTQSTRTDLGILPCAAR